MSETKNAAAVRAVERVERYKKPNRAAAEWAAGYGVIEHSLETQDRVFALARTLEEQDIRGDSVPFFAVLSAADRVANAAMWLVVHETYGRSVYLDGRDLRTDDFKPQPEGHTGGALNMVPAYVGYLAVNALTGLTRSWVMGQGHTVAAVDSVNLLVANMTPAHAARYSLTDEGLTRYVRDFYSGALNDHGYQDSPLGSHVNMHTAGGMVEGGYLGFTELQYVHMPLKGERLVAFLSDGAFEEQRGSDWAPRWWRASDCGLVAPIMIANGRRIDQRTTMSQEGGIEWFAKHLELNSFDPIIFDGRDPASFAWAIFEQENRLQAAGTAAERGDDVYPVRLPYGIAVAPKGAGFYGEGTNLAHNLPLGGNPHTDAAIAHLFNESARRLWVPPDELADAVTALSHHDAASRPRERDNALAHREVRIERVPELEYQIVPADRVAATDDRRVSPMTAVDEAFAAYVRENPHLRPRVGNPDEMKSNRMLRTLDELRFRVTDPEPGMPEAVNGAVITALNEEAIAAAALANKGGINIIVTYEAFGAKMYGGLRQEITWAAQARDAGRSPGWLAVPLVLTSHTWENAKNEISHQDPSLAEAHLSERCDVSHVVFPPDYNTALATMKYVYGRQGEFWTLVVPKTPVPNLFNRTEAEALVQSGFANLAWAGHRHADARLIITAIGSFQLAQVLKASQRLRDRDMAHRVAYMHEPARFRKPRSKTEAAHVLSPEVITSLYPAHADKRIFVTHTRPEPLLGLLQRLHTGASTMGLGFLNRGGTLNVEGLLFVNECSWAHVLAETARLYDVPLNDLLAEHEMDALERRRSPAGIIF